ncbi:MAG: hypothetical protein HOQ26_05515 [Gemmatimonadaceae bacterium]|nr:hypothetical protein [Gemmatimonadaceae bacterium]NUQ92359.1 hypothetical protein [Gemmatimonadaceae bacterium]
MTYSGPVHDPGVPPRPTVVQRTTTVAKAGVGFGSALAITISWSVDHSILWAIIHGFFSWFYVAYYALFLRR